MEKRLVDVESWSEARALELLTCAGRGFADVLDVLTLDASGKPPRIEGLNSMRYHFVERDVEVVFGPEVAAALGKLPVVEERIKAAFSLRENLINMKKIYLHLLREVELVEIDINRFTTMFYSAGKAQASELREQQKKYEDERERLRVESPFGFVYAECASALMRAKGLRLAMRAGREFTKRVCCVPRHPLKPADPFLKGMPHSFELYFILREIQGLYACDFDAIQTEDAALEQLGREEQAVWGNLDLGRYSLPCLRPRGGTPDPKCEEPECDPRFSAGDIEAQETLDQVLCTVREELSASLGKNVDDGAMLFLRRVFIARGAAKVIRIVSETRRLEEAIHKCISTVQEMGSLCRRRYERDCLRNFRMVIPAMNCEECAEPLRDCASWLQRLRTQPQKMWFLGGDWGLFRPEGFGSHIFRSLDNLRALVKEHEPMLSKVLFEPGMETHRVYIVGSCKCKVCERGYSRPFYNNRNSICFFCEKGAREAARAEAERLAAAEPSGARMLVRCPLKGRCYSKHLSVSDLPNTMCPHSFQCFVCDAWSCDTCGIANCDAEAAMNIICDSRPDVLFLDFDKTLATTKAGANPLAHTKQDGRSSRNASKMVHSVCPNLAKAAREHDNVHVVTRNSHVADIEVFLANNRLAHIRVHNPKRMNMVSKAQVIDSILGADQTAIFVDDSVPEIVCEQLSTLKSERAGKLKTILLQG